MNTQEIMKIALELVGFKTIPHDSEIYVEGENIRKILIGIDMGVPELLLAKQLNYDAVISHHPQGGRAKIEGYLVFERHIQQMVEAGIPLKVAEKAIQAKKSSLEIQSHATNYDHAVSVARLLNMPFMNIHNPLDEMGRRIMADAIQRKIEGNKTALVEDVVEALREIPEFRNALTKVKVVLGSNTNKAGRVVVSHGAFTNGGYGVAREYFRYGIGTVVYIHISDSDLTKLKKDGAGNLIVLGHIASDSVGINPFIKELNKRGISVTRMSGIVSQ